MNTIDKYETNSGIDKFFSVTDFMCNLIEAVEKSKLGDLIKNPCISAIYSTAEETIPVVNFFIKFLSKITVPQDKDEQCLIVCSLAYRHALTQTLKDCSDIVMNITIDDRTQVQKRIREYKWSKLNADTFDIYCALSTSFVKDADTILLEVLKHLGICYFDRIKFLNQIHFNFQTSLIEVFSYKPTKEKFQNLIEFINNRPKTYSSRIILQEWAEYHTWLFTHCPLYMEKEFALRDIYVKPQCYDPKDRRTKDLEDIVIKNMRSEKFNSFIAINGTAGAGKSTFTLSLCSKLVDMGMIPIRIPFKKIKFDTTKKYFSEDEIYSILEKAISFQDKTRYGEFYPQVPKNLFCEGEIFNDRILFGKAYISPYILILDGWDELNNDIQQRMRAFLTGLHHTFIRNQNNKIRVILTGRPNKTMEIFWASIKPLMLNIKAFNASEMTELLNKLDYFYPLEKKYKEALIKEFREKKAFDILKSPLIVYILHELLTDSMKKINVEELFKNKALLYQTLADITCENAGKKKLDVEGQFDTKLYGEKLRIVLKKTATVISVKGEELVTYNDLKQILNDEELAITEDEISKALVSYYFKGKNYNAGCEFIHKSFREYFFAESIFDTVIHGNDKSDFEASILKLLSTKCLQDEEIIFLEGLFDSRIKDPYRRDMEFIQSVRKSLIKLWNSWIDQCYVRYKATKDNSVTFPIANVLNNIIKLLKSNVYTPEYFNSTLGVNLLLLNVMFNKVFLRKCGIDTLKDIEITQKQNFLVKFKSPKNSNLILSTFAPFAKRSLNIRDTADLIQHLCNGVDMWLEFDLCYFDSVSINSANVADICFRNCYLKTAIFSCAGLHMSSFENSYLNNCVFTNCDLSETHFDNCTIEKTLFQQVDLSSSNITNTTIIDTKFQNVDAQEIKIEECEIQSAKFEFANMMNMEVENTKLIQTSFKNSDLFKTKIFSSSFLEDVKFINSYLKQAEFHASNLYKISFNFCELNKTIFSTVAMRQACLADCALVDSTFRGNFYKDILFNNTRLERNFIAQDSSEQMQLSPDILKNFKIIS